MRHMFNTNSSPSSIDRQSSPVASNNGFSNSTATMTTNSSGGNSKQATSGGPMSWVCPSDRQLMLRAMLGAGWSNRSRDPTTPLKAGGSPLLPRDKPVLVSSNGGDAASREAITEEEKRHIAEILRKAEQTKRVEQNRIETLRSRVQALKIQTRGDGYNSCLLCGEGLGLFRRAAKCEICGQRFCDKCSAVHYGRSGSKVTLCRVCHEQREVWKRSGAWQNGELTELDPPSRSVSILSNSSSNKGGVVDPNALLGQTGWRRYRSIHGHTTVVKPGRTAVLSESVDTDSESEFDANMLGDTTSPPSVPQTDRLPRKFPENNNNNNSANTENTPATAPSSPTPSSRHNTFYGQLAMPTEAASRFFSYAVSRMGWGAGEDKVAPPESYTPPPLSPLSPPSNDGQDLVDQPPPPPQPQKPFTSVKHRLNNLSINSESDQEPKLAPTFSQLFASPSVERVTMMPLDDVPSPVSRFLPASSSNRALSSPVTSAEASWSKPSDDSTTDDAQSTTSSNVNAGAQKRDITGSKPDLAANVDAMSVKSLKLLDHEEAPSMSPAFDTTSVRSLNVSSRLTKSTRPTSLHGAISGPICNAKPEHDTASPSSSNPRAPVEAKLAPATIDRRRLSADVSRYLETKSMPQSASSSKVALVIAASTATNLLATPTTCDSALGPLSTGKNQNSRTAPHKASTSDLSSPTSSMSSISYSVSQRKLHQRDSNATAAESDVDSDVAYQVPNGGPSIAITEPGNAPDGTLHFTLMYDTAASTLICRVISAKDLPSKDINGLSDPYVKVELLPDPCKASLVKSNVVKKCLNPTWDETIVYEGVLEDDMKVKTLRVQVFDKDTIGYDDFIGETRTTLSCLPTDRLLSYNVVLKPAQKEPKLLSGAALLDVGRIRLTFLYNSAESVFSVSGLRLARLARAGKKSNKDPPSPIIQIRLLVQSAPAATQPAFQTQTHRRCVNCSFGASEVFKEKISLKELAKRVVDISVWDGHVNKADCLLGSVQFGITSHGHQLRHFYQAVKTTDIAHTRWHALAPPPSGNAAAASAAGSTASPASPAQSVRHQSTSSSSPMIGSKRFQ